MRNWDDSAKPTTGRNHADEMHACGCKPMHYGTSYVLQHVHTVSEFFL